MTAVTAQSNIPKLPLRQSDKASDVEVLYQKLKSHGSKIPSSVANWKMSYWRDGLPTVNCQADNNDLVHVSSAVIPDSSKATSCMAACSGTNYLVVGSLASSAGKNLYVLEYEDGGDNVNTLSNSGPFKIVGTYQNGASVRSVDLNKNMILSGCQKNYVQLCRYGEGAAVSAVQKYVHPQEKFQSSNEEVDSLYSNSVQSVKWYPGSQGCFSACENNNIRIWDVSRDSAPVYSVKASEGTILCSSWDTAGNAVLAVGSSCGSVNVVDTRCFGFKAVSQLIAPSNTPTPWFHYRAHQKGKVLSVDWNPHVSFWIASADSYGTTKLWDLRYVPSYGPYSVICSESAVNSVSWSKQHSEILSTADSDGNWTLMNVKSNLIQQVKTGSSDVDYVLGAQVICQKQDESHEIRWPLKQAVQLNTSKGHGQSWATLSSVGDVNRYHVDAKLINSLALSKNAMQEDDNQSMSGASRKTDAPEPVNHTTDAKSKDKSQQFIDVLENGLGKRPWKFETDQLYSSLQRKEDTLRAVQTEVNLFSSTVDPFDIAEGKLFIAKNLTQESIKSYEDVDFFYDVDRSLIK
ncbi:hypothetical protein MP228_011225 [Amoeboaphelidium protococcarum]|nr:hypothetical protein MP228_011225 [Amoeboaphelidium protococcarum]